MLRFVETKVAKEEFCDAKKPIKNWHVDVNNIVNSKLVETKHNPKYMTEYLDKVTKALVLILPEMNWDNKTFKVKDEMEIKIGTINWCLYV